MPQDPIRVQVGEDIVEFPAGTPESEMRAAIESQLSAKRREPEGSAIGRFASGVGEMLNPVTIAEGIYQTVRHPIDTMTGIASQMGEQIQKGAQAGREGRYAEALGRTVAGAVPIVGPLAADISEQAYEGDWAGAAGRATGLAVGPKVYGTALKGAGRMAKAAANPERLASSLERGAASRVVDVMAPKIGPNKTRFGGMAEEVAPKLAKEDVSKSFSREGLHEKVSTKLGEAEQALDAAADARLKAQSFPTEPIIDDLLKQRAKLTSQPLEASLLKPKVGARYSRMNEPYGEAVVPAPHNPRVAVIDQAIAEVKALGPRASYDALKNIRQAWDGPAKAIYSPSMTQDFLKAQGGKMGAADVTGTLREHLANADPGTATANAQYSFWRKANDVLEATAEVERTRPKVGRVIAARIAATVLGGSAAGPTGAAAGLLGGPMIESILSSAPTTKLRTARVMSRLAEAIRRGDVGHVNSLTSELTRLSGVQ